MEKEKKEKIQSFKEKIFSGGKTATGQPADNVVTDPNKATIDEEKESTGVFTFGRFNPPTVGHEKLIHKVESVAKEHGGEAHIVASHSENTSKDPLPQSKKLGYLKKVASSSTQVSGSSKEAPNFLHIAKKLHQAGHKHLVMVAGSDRVDEYKERLNKYNGHPDHYNFKSIKVVSAGARDPDAEGVEGMSGTKMRSLARAGKHDEFKAGLPKSLHPHAKEIGDHIRSIGEEVELDELSNELLQRYKMKASDQVDDPSTPSKVKYKRGLGHLMATIKQMKSGKPIPEEVSLDEAADIRQRLKRSMIMKRNKAKVQRARELARNRLANIKQIRRRALKRAKQMLRQRMAGQRGAGYASLSTTDKIAVDRMLDKRKGQIIRTANRITPRVKRDEIRRLSAVAAGKKVVNTKLPLVASFQISDKEEKYLMEKAESSQLPIDLLRTIFMRGKSAYTNDNPPNMSSSQYAFNRLASFLNKGRSYKKDDKDVAEAANKMKGEDPCWDGYEMVGTKKKNGKEVPNCVPKAEK